MCDSKKREYDRGGEDRGRKGGDCALFVYVPEKERA